MKTVIIAIGIDVHKDKCAAFAVSGGKGDPKPRHQAFLDKFNEDFRRFPSDALGMNDLAERLKDHEAHILIENSTKSHDVYWMLKGLGLDVTVAHAADLVRITKSLTKTDDNDSVQLAGYMRRKLWGEIEFSVCHIPTTKVCRQREMCRIIFGYHEQLTVVKQRIRAILLIRGWKLTREYDNIVSGKALAELEAYREDTPLQFYVAEAKHLKKAIFESERTLRYMMQNSRLFQIVYSVTGVGVQTAGYFVCMVDTMDRFESGKDLAASIGLTPKLRESADKPKNCGISRRGDADLRRLMCQAAFVHVFHEETSFISEKYRRLKAAGKSHNEAIVACANSMCQLIYALVRDDREYVTDPATLSRARVYAESDQAVHDMEAKSCC